jgi:hypothetical protein
MRLLAALASCVAAAPVPTPIGIGPRYQLPAGPPLRAARCVVADAARVDAHVELFANKRALLIPSGVGVSKRCAYAVRTTTPTGVVAATAHATVGDLFAVWGQPLARARLASFHGRVRAWVGGCPWSGPVAAIPLTRHAEIVLEVGGYVPPHAFFLFPR